MVSSGDLLLVFRKEGNPLKENCALSTDLKGLVLFCSAQHCLHQQLPRPGGEDRTGHEERGRLHPLREHHILVAVGSLQGGSAIL